MAEARKLAGNVSEESEVTPRRSFSLNIFLQEGERVKVLVPSCRKVTPVMAPQSKAPAVWCCFVFVVTAGRTRFLVSR